MRKSPALALGNRRSHPDRSFTMILRHPSGRTQWLAVSDLQEGGTEVFGKMVEASERPVHVLYCDPPWSAANEKYWRTVAGVSASPGYDRFLEAWLKCISLCRAGHVFVEQSVNAKHNRVFRETMRTCLEAPPFVEEWKVSYGRNRAGGRYSNLLLHYGHNPVGSDPSGMSGDRLVRCVFQGLSKNTCVGLGAVIVDPCMGFGTTSRIAHQFECDFIGMELNNKRIGKALDWLIGHGYRHDSSGS